MTIPPATDARQRQVIMTEERRAAVETLVKDLNKIHAYIKGKERLISRDEWGATNFEGISNAINMASSFVEDLRALPTHRLHEWDITELQSPLSSIRDLLHRIDSFDIDRNPVNGRNELQLAFRDCVEKLSRIAVPCIRYLACVDAGVTRLLGEAIDKPQDSEQVTSTTMSSASTTEPNRVL